MKRPERDCTLIVVTWDMRNQGYRGLAVRSHFGQHWFLPAAQVVWDDLLPTAGRIANLAAEHEGGDEKPHERQEGGEDYPASERFDFSLEAEQVKIGTPVEGS